MTLAQIEAALSQLESNLGSITGFIHNSILETLRPIPGVGAVINWIDNEVMSIEEQLRRAQQGVQQQISQGIDNLLPNAIELLQAAVTEIAHGIQQITSNVATAEDVVASAITTIRRYAPPLESWIYERITQGFGNTVLGALHALELESPQAIDPLLDHILDNPDLPDWVRDMIGAIRGRHAPWIAAVLPILAALAIVPIAESLLHPTIRTFRQSAEETTPSALLDIPALLEARFRGVIPDARYFDELKKQGLNGERAGILFQSRFERLQPVDAARLLIRGQMQLSDFEREMSERGIDSYRAALLTHAARPLLSEDNIRDAWLRGQYSDAQHDAALAQHGYSQEQIDVRKRLYFVVPGPADLIHMAIRNTFSPEIVERFQLFSDFPADFKRFAAQAGISEFWAQHYWGAHWIVPSNTEGFEAFQRTTDKSLDPNADTLELEDGTKVQNIIGRSTLQLLLREKDTAPFWRDKLTELAYHPLTRIDIRRMHLVGILTKSQVERAYLDNGYAPLNARRLANYVERANDREHKDRAAPILDRLRNRVLSLYVADKLDLSDATFALSDFGFDDAEIKAFTAEADLIRQADEAQALEAGIGKLFTRGFIDEPEARKELLAVKVPVTAIDTLIRKWKLELAYRGGSEEIHRQRDLTKSEVLAALKDGMVSEADTLAVLEKLGYDENESHTLIGLALFQQAKESRAAQLNAQKALYIAGTQDQLATSNELDRLGIPPAQRDALLSEWRLTREQRVTLIPLATLRDMVQNHFMGESDALTQLTRHRFSETDAALLLRFWMLHAKALPTGGQQIGA